MVAFFRRPETVRAGLMDVDVKQPGVYGPVRDTPVSATRRFPLRQPIKQAWSEAGLAYNPGSASGNSAGLVKF